MAKNFILLAILFGVVAAVMDDPMVDSNLPWDIVPVDQLRSSAKKVYSHYFAPFPVSIDNKQPNADYYNNQYLSPHGENNKWFFCGGYLRCRPYPRAPLNDTNFKLRDLEMEVRRAIHYGLDGFTYDILTTSNTSNLYPVFPNLLNAAANVDSEFKVFLNTFSISF